MSLQALIDAHANNITARHDQIEGMMRDVAASRAAGVTAATESIADALETTGSAVGGLAGAYHLGRTVYRKYRKDGLKAAAKKLAEAGKKKLKDNKPEDDDDDDDGAGDGDGAANDKPPSDKPTPKEGEGDAPSGEGDLGPTGTATDDPAAVSDRLDSMLKDAQGEASEGASSTPSTNASVDSSAPETSTSAPETSGPNLGEAREVDAFEPQADLNFKLGSVDEPEALQTRRWADMAQRVFARNRAQGLDIEGNPLTSDAGQVDEAGKQLLKPAERVLADVQPKAPQQTSDGQSVEDQTTVEEPDAPSTELPTRTPQASEQADIFKQRVQELDQGSGSGVEAPSDAPPVNGGGSAADSDAVTQAKNALSAGDDAAKAAQQAGKQALKGAGDGILDDGLQAGTKVGTRVLGSGLKETLSNVGGQIAEKVGLQSALETAGGVLDAIPVVGEFAGLAMAIAGLVEGLEGKKGDVSKQEGIVPVAAAQSAIDPTNIIRATS